MGGLFSFWVSRTWEPESHLDNCKILLKEFEQNLMLPKQKAKTAPIKPKITIQEASPSVPIIFDE